MALGRRAALFCAALFVSLPGQSAAQSGLLLKRLLPGAQAPTSCPAATRPPAPPPGAEQEAQRFAQSGTDAALLGNQNDARTNFARAAELDPTSESIAYQFARVLEDASANPDAAREYCRYLALAPEAADAEEVRQRIASLGAGGGATVGEEAAVQFRTGLAYADRGQYAQARGAFSAAIVANPEFPEAFYDRAAINVRERRYSDAALDLERYAALAPDAADRAATLRQSEILRSGARSGAAAAAVGMLFPGGGQFYTGRPVMGTLYAVAGAGAVALVFYRSSEERTVFFTDPNGIEIPRTIVVPTTPGRAVGFGGLGVILIAGAFEAYSHIAGERRMADRIRAATLPGESSMSTATPAVRPWIGASKSGTVVGFSIGF